jgi:virulence factor Mce-like protein
MKLSNRGARNSARGALGAATVMLLAGCAAGLQSLPLPTQGGSADTITLNAVFADALNLPTKAKVKLNGADIGEVASMRAQDYRAYVQMRVDSNVPLFAGATAQLRSATPLGDIFVAISPDPKQVANAPRLRDGDTIPLESTKAAATIEDVLSSAALLVNGGTVGRFVSVINGVGSAVGTSGAGITTLLHQSDAVLSRLNARSEQIRTALRNTSKLATTLNAREETINKAVAAAAPAASVIADNASQLADLTDTVGEISRQLSRFPSLQGTDTRSVIADLNHLSDQFSQIAQDPNINLAKVNPLMPLFVKLTDSTAIHANATIVRLAFGNHPDKNYPGDPATHGPDGTDWHFMVGSLRYEWNLLLDKMYGPNR